MYIEDSKVKRIYPNNREDKPIIPYFKKYGTWFEHECHHVFIKDRILVRGITLIFWKWQVLLWICEIG